MRRSLRQATHFFDQFFPADAPCSVNTLALRQLGNGRSASHRRHAPFGKKTNFSNLTAVEPNAELKDVSAHGILQARGSVRHFDRPWISRILKMIEKLSRVHTRIVMRREVEIRDQIAEVKPCLDPKGFTSAI